MKQVRSTIVFERDLKRLVKRGKNIKKIHAVVSMLVNNIPLPSKFKPHKLTGDYYLKWECHIEPDWLLVYEIKEDVVILYRTGTHSDLF
ncbi:MAG TPA: type II toxin-antitoxin system YafQ family toxin [Rickettsia endosymbiont of Bembidion nr. Transversale]|nr:type II toxin-antitoxin system YafQ family toxin [Rickettsia endosymbiont of Stiretrus anchorago]HJD66737.1 type II toxin-antitoxin system YafQ family toxin [Rickettsia endosymbiont of Bembidion nr. Transversale]